MEGRIKWFIPLLLVLLVAMAVSCTPAKQAQTGDTAKPVETETWKVSTYASAGVTWDVLPYMAAYIEDMSGGRLKWDISAPGVLCPVEEQLEFLDSGAADVMSVASGYYSGKIPLCFLQTNACGLLRDPSEMREVYEIFENGRIQDLFEQEYAKFGDLHLVGNIYRDMGGVFFSKVPIYTVDDVKGVKWRASEQTAKALDILGAATVWCPGSEIYTMLSTGAVDCSNFGGAYTNMKMSFHEVTKYWLRYPSFSGPSCDGFIVNGTTWNELPDDLKAMVKMATEAGSLYATTTERMGNARAWAFLQDYGIELIRWSEADANKWSETLRIVLQDYLKDDACKEATDVLGRFMVEMGYWK